MFANPTSPVLLGFISIFLEPFSTVGQTLLERGFVGKLFRHHHDLPKNFLTVCAFGLGFAFPAYLGCTGFVLAAAFPSVGGAVLVLVGLLRRRHRAVGAFPLLCPFGPTFTLGSAWICSCSRLDP